MLFLVKTLIEEYLALSPRHSAKVFFPVFL
jgi:hypothetical protein